MILLLGNSSIEKKSTGFWGGGHTGSLRMLCSSAVSMTGMMAASLLSEWPRSTTADVGKIVLFAPFNSSLLWTEETKVPTENTPSQYRLLSHWYSWSAFCTPTQPDCTVKPLAQPLLTLQVVPKNTVATLVSTFPLWLAAWGYCCRDII